jgi:hypothetical protein
MRVFEPIRKHVPKITEEEAAPLIGPNPTLVLQAAK